MTAPQPVPQTADGQNVPSKLKLAFSKAADNGRISHLFDPAIKSRIDPQNFVVKRDQTVFDATVARGGAAFLYDTTTGEVHTLTMAYQVNDKNTGDHVYSEVGTSLARIAGYSSAKLVVAAIALKEWWSNPPSDMITTEILPGNGPSLHLYRDSLGWSEVTDTAKAAELHRLCNEYIDPADQGRPTTWFCCDSSVLPKMAQTLLDYMDNGVLLNKKTGHQIDLDLGELAQIGLDRTILENIAKGITDKNMLQSSAPTAPQP